MNIFFKSVIIHLVIIVGLTIPACTNTKSIQPAPTYTATLTLLPRKPTRTPTEKPTRTSLPTNTPTITPTPTLPPPPDDFSKARVYSSGPQQGWDFSITLLLPEPILGEYTAVVGESQKTYICRKMTEYAHPERLFCLGRIPAAGKQVDFFIVDKSTGLRVFHGNVYAPIP